MTHITIGWDEPIVLPQKLYENSSKNDVYNTKIENPSGVSRMLWEYEKDNGYYFPNFIDTVQKYMDREILLRRTNRIYKSFCFLPKIHTPILEYFH